MKVVGLYISAKHNFVGHHGKDAGTCGITPVERVECVAGRGIRGDRFFDHKPDFKGQITFFARETHDQIRRDLDLESVPISAYRRNVITEDADLNALVGKEFEIQGVRFLGTEECRPCYWMNQAVGSGAEDALSGTGGLRARILSSGTLHVEAD